MKMILAVALGGAIGAIGRHYVTRQFMHVMGTGFPWGTLAVNILGSLVMGILVEVMALRWSVGLETRGFIITGVLGAFTTFSTFSLDFAILYERGEVYLAVGYAAVSVTLAFAGLFLGLYGVRALLS